jgi:uncharacterized membrane protein YsdA (DUF1294 family)
MPWLPALLAWLGAVNLVTLASFARDKRAARIRARRVPEARLLTLAVLGGTPAAFAGRHLFRHKTRKQPFNRQLGLIALGQAMLGAALLLQAWR